MTITRLKYDKDHNVSMKLFKKEYTIIVKTRRIYDVENLLSSLGQLFHTEREAFEAPYYLNTYVACLAKYNIKCDYAYLSTSDKYYASKLRAIATNKRFLWGIYISAIKDNIEYFSISRDNVEDDDLLVNNVEKKVLIKYINSLIQDCIYNAKHKEATIFHQDYIGNYDDYAL